MTIDKAIELQELYLKSIMPSHLTDLGTEALKWIKAGRREGCYQCPPTLPGETKQ